MADIIGDALIRVKIDTDDARAKARESKPGTDAGGGGDERGKGNPQTKPEGSGSAPRPSPTPPPESAWGELEKVGMESVVAPGASRIVDAGRSIPGLGPLIDAVIVGRALGVRVTGHLKPSGPPLSPTVRPPTSVPAGAPTGAPKALPALGGAGAGAAGSRVAAGAAAGAAAVAAVLIASPAFHRAGPSVGGFTRGAFGFDLGAPGPVPGLSRLETASPIFAVGRGVTRLSQKYTSITDGVAAGTGALTMASLLGHGAPSDEQEADAVNIGFQAERISMARERVAEEMGRTMDRAGSSAVGSFIRKKVLDSLGLDEVAR